MDFFPPAVYRSEVSQTATALGVLLLSGFLTGVVWEPRDKVQCVFKPQPCLYSDFHKAPP